MHGLDQSADLLTEMRTDADRHCITPHTSDAESCFLETIRRCGVAMEFSQFQHVVFCGAGAGGGVGQSATKYSRVGRLASANLCASISIYAASCQT